MLLLSGVVPALAYQLKTLLNSSSDTPTLPMMQGYCRSNDGTGGMCGYGTSSSVEDCIQGGVKLGYNTFQIQGGGTVCSYMSYSRDKPTNCPSGFHAQAGGAHFPAFMVKVPQM